jgi:diguanylate cyclase (GGDEF)-like protein
VTFLSDDGSRPPTHLLPVLSELFDRAGTAVSLFDEDGRLLYANDQYYDLVCHTRGTYPYWPDVIRDNHARGVGLIINADDIEEWIRTALAKRRVDTYRQFEVDAWDGRWLLMTETLIPGVGLLNIGVDITQAKNIAAALKQEYQSAMVKAETDLLTDMGNRRALERLRKLFVSKGRHHQVTALMIDIDQFKIYNDRLGHLKGDDCLRQVAEIIRNSLRVDEAYPVRLGGDEFLVLMLDTQSSLAHQVAQRIRDGILELAIPHPGTASGLVTLSMGIASHKIADAESLSLLIKDADDALYTAKRGGRDRITESRFN